MLNSPHLKRTCEFAFEILRLEVLQKNKTSVPKNILDMVKKKRFNESDINKIETELDTNSEFRLLVAEVAQESNIGRAGYLWLVRPSKWEIEYKSIISNGGEDYNGEFSTLGKVPIGGNGDVENQLQNFISDPPPKPPIDYGLDGENEMAELTEVEGSSGSDSLRNELSSLRGLVDRLADERELMSKSSNNGFPVNTSAFNVEIESFKRRLSTLESQIKHSTNSVRDSKQLSEALKRQVNLERELADTREVRSSIEAKLSEAEVKVRETQDKIVRAETDKKSSEKLVSKLTKEVEEVSLERSKVKEEHTSMKIERDEAVSRLGEIDRLAGGVDIGTLQKDNRLLAERAFEAESDLVKLQTRLDVVEKTFNEEKQLADTLQTEKSELLNRLSESDTALESARVSLGTYKNDTKRVVVENEELRNQVSDLMSQIDELQGSLSGALADYSKVRSEGDHDREAFRRMRSERDSLLARVSEVEQVDQQNSRALKDLETERKKLLERQDELINERGRLKGETAAAQRENDQMTNRLQLLQDKLEPLENEMLIEKRRVEELSANLAEANKERNKISDDIKKIQQDQAQSNIATSNLAGVAETSEKVASTQQKENLQPAVVENPEIEKLKKELAESESSREVLKQELETTQENNLNKTIEEDVLNETEKELVSPTVAKEDLTQLDNNLDLAEEVFVDANPSTKTSVWDQDWPPGSDDDFDEFDSSVREGAYVAEIPNMPVKDDLEDIDIDEISELLSRTVTDFQAIDDSLGIDAPPSVFDSATQTWVTDDVSSQEPVAKDSDSSAFQQALSVENSVLLVDGDAVASLGWSRLSIKEQRNSLVSFLAHISEHFGVAAQVVFDGEFAGQDSLPHSRLVRIRLSNSPMTTGSVITELLETFPPAWPKIVVSDVAKISQESKVLGASVYSNEELLDFIYKFAS